MMLKEMLGEEEVLGRLRQVLVDFKHQSLVTSRFIQQVSRGEDRLQKFFNSWVYARKLPRVRYRVAISGQEAEITFAQEDSDFVFPVAVSVSSAEGKYSRTLIVEEKAQKFRIMESSPILAIDVEALAAPIILER
jgi:aminopeptidase N